MSAPDILVNEMRSIGAVIREARTTLDAGGLIDVSPLEARVDKLCRALNGSPAEDAARLRDDVRALIADFDQLAGMIEARLADLKKGAASGEDQVRAASAYREAGRSEPPER
jgi:hypothetical protein